MGHFVLDEVMDFIDRHISLDRDSVQERLCHTKDALRELKQICLVEFCGSSVIEKGHGSGKLVFDVLADRFIGTLSQACDCLKVAGVIPVVKNVEVVGFVNLPVEFCVKDFILPIIGEVDNLREA
jgi:hypothetical protein